TGRVSGAGGRGGRTEILVGPWQTDDAAARRAQEPDGGGAGAAGREERTVGGSGAAAVAAACADPLAGATAGAQPLAERQSARLAALGLETGGAVRRGVPAVLRGDGLAAA